MSEPTLADLVKTLDLATGTPDKVPPGWFTVLDVVEETGKSHSTISEKLRTQAREGRLKRKQFTIRTPDGGLREVWHYRAVKRQ